MSCWTQYGLNNFFLRNMASDFSICEKDVRKWKSDFQETRPTELSSLYHFETNKFNKVIVRLLSNTNEY
ncbi:hypothetical protein HanIR_Chr09g0412521 [Helianthus annuus]|nr:hypothetical protein HanIR_Chr09g0412521 [Helianthus annuus]